jgi:hypothetical protein
MKIDRKRQVANSETDFEDERLFAVRDELNQRAVTWASAFLKPVSHFPSFSN